jgi:hypothetical protein
MRQKGLNQIEPLRRWEQISGGTSGSGSQSKPKFSSNTKLLHGIIRTGVRATGRAQWGFSQGRCPGLQNAATKGHQRRSAKPLIALGLLTTDNHPGPAAEFRITVGRVQKGASLSRRRSRDWLDTPMLAHAITAKPPVITLQTTSGHPPPR